MSENQSLTYNLALVGHGLSRFLCALLNGKAKKPRKQRFLASILEVSISFDKSFSSLVADFLVTKEKVGRKGVFLVKKVGTKELVSDFGTAVFYDVYVNGNVLGFFCFGLDDLLVFNGKDVFSASFLKDIKTLRRFIGVSFGCVVSVESSNVKEALTKRKLYESFIQKMPTKHTIAVDWLSLMCVAKSHHFNEMHLLDVVDELTGEITQKKRPSLKLGGGLVLEFLSGTRVYKNRAYVWFNYEKVATLLYNKSVNKVKNQTSDDIKLDFQNFIFYRKGFVKIVRAVIDGLGLKFLHVTRLDIAIDTPKDVFDYARWVECVFLQNKLVLEPLGSAKFTLGDFDFLKKDGERLDNLILGKPSSGRTLSIYDKTKEIEKKSFKSYISDFWLLNDLISDKADVVNRVELRLTRKFMSKLKASIDLDSLESLGYLAGIFKTFNDGFFQFVPTFEVCGVAPKKERNVIDLINYKFLGGELLEISERIEKKPIRSAKIAIKHLVGTLYKCGDFSAVISIFENLKRYGLTVWFSKLWYYWYLEFYKEVCFLEGDGLRTFENEGIKYDVLDLLDATYFLGKKERKINAVFVGVCGVTVYCTDGFYFDLSCDNLVNDFLDVLDGGLLLEAFEVSRKNNDTKLEMLKDVDLLEWKSLGSDTDVIENWIFNNLDVSPPNEKHLPINSIYYSKDYILRFFVAYFEYCDYNLIDDTGMSKLFTYYKHSDFLANDSDIRLEMFEAFKGLKMKGFLEYAKSMLEVGDFMSVKDIKEVVKVIEYDLTKPLVNNNY